MGKRPHRAAVRARSSAGLSIRMVVPSLELHAPDPLAVSLGGTETAGLQLAAELVRQGHRVTIIGIVAAPFAWRGVRMVAEMGGAEAGEPCDLFLVLRAPEYLKYRGRARATMLWLHDQPDVGVGQWADDAADLADRVLCVSQWQGGQLAALAPDLAGHLAIMRNGVDLDLIAEATAGAEPVDPYRLAFVSRPERGLDVLLQNVFPAILAAEPRASLHVATYAYPAIEAELANHYRWLRALAEAFGDRVVWHQPKGKADLYRLLAGSGLMLYPTPAAVGPGFRETFCIAAVEAMACGCPVVTTDAGALPETVGDAGVLVPMGTATHAGAPAVVDALVAAALRVMREPAHADELRRRGRERGAELGWAPVAADLIREATLAATEAAARRAPAAPTPLRNRKRIVIATPIYNFMMHKGCTESLLHAILHLRDLGHDVSWINNSLASVRLARNGLAGRFLKEPDATHLMWVDADVGFPRDAVARLLAHDVEVVGGLYPAKRLPLDYVFSPVTDAAGRTRRLTSGPVEVDRIDGGFVLVKREVYQALLEGYPERAAPRGDARVAAAFDFYPERLENGQDCWEDFGFCQSWRSLGGMIWADLSLNLTHYGWHAYKGDPMAAFAPERVAA